jgi:hypothetical protein
MASQVVVVDEESVSLRIDLSACCCYRLHVRHGVCLSFEVERVGLDCEPAIVRLSCELAIDTVDVHLEAGQCEFVNPITKLPR